MFFVVPRNAQVLLGMQDTAALKIINIKVDSIQAAKEDCHTNICDTKESNNTHGVHVMEKNCTNMDADSKVDNNVNGYNNITNVNTLINYFLSSPNVEANTRKSIKLM